MDYFVNHFFGRLPHYDLDFVHQGNDRVRRSFYSLDDFGIHEDFRAIKACHAYQVHCSYEVVSY